MYQLKKIGICIWMIMAVVLAFFFQAKTTVFAEENEFPTNLFISVNGAESKTIKAVNAYYENNYYISARDLAAALSGTEKQFQVTVDKGFVAFERGVAYEPQSNDNRPFSEEDLDRIYTAKARLNQITLDGREVRYYTFIIQVDGKYECFLRMSDAALMFDLMIYQSQEVWNIETSLDYEPNLKQMEEYGYFAGMNSALVADATTGEIYYGYDIDRTFAIASITKLMNYIVLMDAIDAKEMSWNDMVTISKKVAQLSRADDGMYPMAEGKKVPAGELVKAMLVPSCNEAALALAEHLCGSEEAFVLRMNEKAKELGLKSAKFYSSNGLPVYSNTLFAAKLSNEMSAKDLFVMIRYLLTNYPEVTEITTIQKELLPTLNVEIVNNNPLLYNMTDVKGLKSGTTTRAGTCLSTMREVYDPDGRMHQVVAIELGTETSVDRGSYSEVLMRYGSIMVQRGENGVVIKQGITPIKVPAPNGTEGRLYLLVVETAKRYGLFE